MYRRSLCEWMPIASLAPQSDLGHTTNSGRMGVGVYLVIPPSKHPSARCCQLRLHASLWRYPSVRNAAITELDTWMRDLKVIARVALKDRPQLLEQIGMTM